MENFLRTPLVAEPTNDTMGLKERLGLWILGRPKIIGKPKSLKRKHFYTENEFISHLNNFQIKLLRHFSVHEIVSAQTSSSSK